MQDQENPKIEKEQERLIDAKISLLQLAKELAEGRGIMTENAIKAVKKLKALNEASDQHIEVSGPGELICQDLYFVGVIKGVGKVYLQSAIDCFGSVGFGKLCVSKKPIHSAAIVVSGLSAHFYVPLFSKQI